MNRNSGRATWRRSVIDRFKIRKGCVDCWYKKDSAALEFDHLGDDKVKTVASSLYSSWAVIKAEIGKCEVVCANCHAIRTRNRRCAR